MRAVACMYLLAMMHGNTQSWTLCQTMRELATLKATVINFGYGAVISFAFGLVH
jgi:hypothetical protein